MKHLENTLTWHNNPAFTLAEVLITLVIIGIISAMVIPTLLDRFHKDSTGIALAKAYSTMNQTIIRMARDNNVDGDLSQTNLFNGTDSIIGDELVKFMKVSKNCGMGAGCFTTTMGTEFLPLSTKVATSGVIGNHYSFIGNDSVSYMVQSTGSGCIASYNGSSSASFSNHMKEICGLLWMDLNGFKAPNSWGNDIFLFYITNGVTPTLYPAGGRDDARAKWSNDGVTATNCTKASPNGYTCAGRIMEEGWQVNY